MRFAGQTTGRSLSPSINYSAAMNMRGGGGAQGASVAQHYNRIAQTGWQPGDTLANSIALRGQEKSQAMAAATQIQMSEMLADAKIEAAKEQAEAAKSAASSQSKGAMIGSAIGAIGTIGGALLSDETTKNSIERIDNALKTLRDLKPVTFYYNEEYSSNPERLHYGFIAQDYAKVMPDATYYDESLGKLCIDTSELISLLVRSIQQLEGRLTYLEAVNALTGANR